MISKLLLLSARVIAIGQLQAYWFTFIDKSIITGSADLPYVNGKRNMIFLRLILYYIITE